MLLFPDVVPLHLEAGGSNPPPDYRGSLTVKQQAKPQSHKGVCVWLTQWIVHPSKQEGGRFFKN